MTNHRLVGHGTGWPTEIEIMRGLRKQLNVWRRISVLSSIAGFLLGIVMILVIILASRPNCPTEDSCYPEYSGGRWSIVEGDRP